MYNLPHSLYIVVSSITGCVEMTSLPADVVSASQLVPGPGGIIMDPRVSTFPGKKPKKVSAYAFIIMVK